MANVIQLASTRRSTVVCPQSGVVFPQLYRLTGFHFKLREGVEPKGVFIKSADDLEQSTNPALPTYTLDMERHPVRISSPALQAISTLDSSIDRGWVVIRHHANANSMEAYVDAICDLENDHNYDGRYGLFETNLGCFSVVHRTATPGTPDWLVVYQTKVADSLDIGSMDFTRVVDSQGMWHDGNILLPKEVSEQLGQVTDYVNRNL
jgi:hypothetical protein